MTKLPNALIDRTHKRALRVVYRGADLSLTELLQLDSDVTIHTYQELRTLMTEIYKSLNHTNLRFMWNLFQEKTIPYNLRAHSILTLPSTERKTYGTYAIIFRASLIWNNLPSHIKKAANLIEFQAM